jgi:transcriptional regulator with XRE-family HTH domain
MSLGKNIQAFLTLQINDMKIKKKDFFMKCGINGSIFNKMIKGTFSNPKLSTLTKLADFCNSSIDEILGRDPKYYNSKQKVFLTVTPNTIAENLTSLVKDKMKQLNLSPIQLSSKIGVSDRTLKMFLDPNVSATPGAATTLALANFLDVSIDDIIGRRPPSRTQKQKLDIPNRHCPNKCVNFPKVI